MSKKKTDAKQTAAANAQKPFHIVEAYKTLRTNLLFALATSEKKTVLFTSAEPHAGKSTSAGNLAIVMAQSNFKVLLIDADMRRPRLDKMFRVSRKNGLSKVLGGMQSLEEALVEDVAPNLDFLPAGPIPPNPQELLCSANMTTLLEQASEKYDYIFIDSPPVNLLADALMLTNNIAGMVVVVREGQTTYDELKAAQESIVSIGANILGYLLTDVQQHRKGVYRTRYYRSNTYRYER